MNPLQDLELMEELLIEYSLCYYRIKLANFYRGYQLHPEWAGIRDITCCYFDKLEQQYENLANLLSVKPRQFLQSTMNLNDELVLDTLVKMTVAPPTKLLKWPSGYENLDEVVDPVSLEKRIVKLQVSKNSKVII